MGETNVLIFSHVGRCIAIINRSCVVHVLILPPFYNSFIGHNGGKSTHKINENWYSRIKSISLLWLIISGWEGHDPKHQLQINKIVTTRPVFFVKISIRSWSIWNDIDFWVWNRNSFRDILQFVCYGLVNGILTKFVCQVSKYINIKILICSDDILVDNLNKYPKVSVPDNGHSNFLYTFFVQNTAHHNIHGKIVNIYLYSSFLNRSLWTSNDETCQNRRVHNTIFLNTVCCWPFAYNVIFWGK